MQSIFFNMVGVSITVSIVIIILLLLSSFLSKRYTVKWRYFIWLILALRLLLPINFGLTSPPVELNLADREIIYNVDENQLPKLAPAELGITEDQLVTPEQRTAYEKNLEAYDRKMQAAKKAAGENITVSEIAVIVYFAGIAVFLLWQFGIYLSFRLSARRWYREVTNPEIIKIFEDLRSGMGIQNPFRIRVCRKISSPMIMGLFHPTLLLPHEGYQNIDLEVILKHELVHYRRNDLWFKLLLLCANALHWFNPIIYRMVTEANKDIEISCDEEVLKGADLMLRKRYSERILDLMQGSNHREAPISTSFHGGKGMMKSRIQQIFDERVKKKGIFAFLSILILVMLFSSSSFGIAQTNWQIPIAKEIVDAYGFDAAGNRNDEMADFTVDLSFDMNADGINDTTFSLMVSEQGKSSKLSYENEDGKKVQIPVLEGIEPGVDYGLQAANLEDTSSIIFLISVDYRGMPFGSGYWELYSWSNGAFEKVDMKTVEESLQMKILTAEEVRENAMNAGCQRVSV